MVNLVFYMLLKKVIFNEVEWLLHHVECYTECNEGGKLTSLLHASIYGDIEIIKLLLKKGSSIDDKDIKGNTCLLLAASYGHLDLVQWLLSYGGCSIYDVNLKGSNCILLASIHGNIPMIKWFIEQGLSLQDEDDYGTCIVHAAENNQTEAVIWMLSNGSSILESHKKYFYTCEDYLKKNGTYERISSIYSSKSARK